MLPLFLVLKRLLIGNYDTGSRGEIYSQDEAIGAEMGGGKWLRKGAYKAIKVPAPFGQKEWQLFNISTDPGETRDLAKEYPEKLEELKDAWNTYAEEVGVVIIGDSIMPAQ